MAIKVSKPSVNYSKGHKNGDHCAICQHYQPATQTCEVVKGTIDPMYWCKRFKEKK